MEKLREFVRYMSANEGRLRAAVEKMCGGDADAFGETFVAVWETVKRTKPRVKDWERYFMRAAHRQWTYLKKRDRRYERLEDPDSLPG